MKFVKFSIVSVSLLPILASAQVIQNFTQGLSTLINSIAPLAMTLVFIAFCWGLVKYILSAGDPAKASTGKSIMIYGAIALIVMGSIWGIMAAIQSGLGISGDSEAPGTEIIPGAEN